MRLYTCFLLLIFPLASLAQQARQYAFKHFSTTSGLESNMINAVIQDADGYMWMATANGLQRYDGSSFITFRFRRNDPHSVPSDLLSSFYLDAKKRLWVTSDNNRLGTWDTRKFLFHES